MLEILLGAGGGLIGVVGGLVKQWLDSKQAKVDLASKIELTKLENEHEIAMADKHLEATKFESQNNLAIANLNMLGEVEKASVAAQVASYEHDKATYSVGSDNDKLISIDVLRGKTRPYVTIFNTIALFALTTWAIYLTDVKTFSDNYAELLIRSFIVNANLSVGWWFAASPSRKVETS